LQDFGGEAATRRVGGEQSFANKKRVGGAGSREAVFAQSGYAPLQRNHKLRPNLFEYDNLVPNS